MALNAGSVFYELSAKLDDRAFKLYDKQVDKSIKVTGDLVKVQEKAAKANDKLSKSINDGVDDAKKAAGAQQKLASDTQKTDSAVKKTSGSVEKFTKEISKSDAAMGKYRDEQGKLREANGRYARATQDAARSTQSFRGSVGRLVTGLGVGAGLGMALRFVGRASANFEAQMSKLKSATGASGAQLDRLQKQALKAGAVTKYSALEAAQAQTELAKGGMNLATILSGGLDGALSMAAAGEMELADAAATTANALNLFGLEGSDATKVADMLSAAALSTTADVKDFADALNNGGSFARLAGMSITETMVALEAMAKSGIKGAEAGTMLKSALMNILNPTDKQREAQEKAGISFQDAAGNMKSMAEISDMLRAKTEKMTNAQRASFFKNIAGAYGINALNAVYQAGGKTLQEYEKQLTKTGTSQKVANEIQNNAKENWNNFMGSVETLAIIFGTDYLPTVTKVLQEGMKLVNLFASLPKPVRLAIAALLGLGGAIYVISRLTMAIKMMNMAMKANVWVIAAIAIVAALTFIYKNWDVISRRIRIIWKGVEKAFGKAADWIVDKARRGFLGPVPLILSRWGQIRDFFKSLPGKIGGWLSGLSGKITRPFISAFRSLRGIITDAFNWIRRAVRNTVDFVNRQASKLENSKVGKVVGALGGAASSAGRFLGLAEGGRVGPNAGGPQVFIAGEGGKDEWVISQEGDRKKNIGYAIEALTALGAQGFKLGGRVRRSKGQADRLASRREAMERNYSISQRGYELSGDGIDTAEYAALERMRGRINTTRESEAKVIGRALSHANRDATRLRKQIARSRGAKRQKLTEQLTELNEFRKEYSERRRQLGFEIREGALDIIELRKQAAEAAASASETAAGTDTGGPSLAEQFASFNSSRFDLLRSFGGNTSSLPASVMATAGATGSQGSKRAPTIVNNYTTAPPDPAAWNKQMELQIKAAS